MVKLNFKIYRKIYFTFTIPNNVSALTTTSTAAESDKRIAGDSNESIEKNQPTNEALDESNIGLNATEATKLFQDSDEDEKVEESRLMALCSGTFVTQYPESVSHTNTPIIIK